MRLAHVYNTLISFPVPRSPALLRPRLISLMKIRNLITTIQTTYSDYTYSFVFAIEYLKDL